ncbi:glycosyltransferase family 4 protein [Pseudoalteromonas sp. NZS37]|uniref:glycosyltransferase family 4 protein n=1 Tax=Pseudoalteromonas sp. NZS37 TaxID=2792071 RepID=UPI0018CE81D9|nr:glycosyltransferase [Pseudoalteromonas sp. NZS37]MBG9989996.1 glycosyltransferase [Pseudoalteromonas sp. NZS37]
MKVLACTMEPFYLDKDNAYSHKSSLAFIQGMFGKDNVSVVAQQTYNMIGASSASAICAVDKIEILPSYSSTKEFIFKCVRSPLFYKNWKKSSNLILDKHIGKPVWVRNPTIGSVLFSLLALERGFKVYNHMCANILDGWKNDKYNFFEKAFGFFISLMLKKMLVKISENSNTINLCTGNVLYDFCKAYNSNTYQFVDSTIKPRSPSFISINDTDTQLNLLFIGRVQQDKGIHNLCYVINKLKKDGKNIHLDIIGSGSALISLREKYIKSDCINFLGQIKNNKLESYIHSCHAIVVPSENDYEGFPRVIMESWAIGKPVIVADAGGVKAFVKHEINGLLFPSGNNRALESEVNKLFDFQFYNELCKSTRKMRSISSQEYWVFETQKSLGINQL